MTATLLIIGFILMLAGIIGSVIPALPGPLLSWIGILLIYFCEGMEWNWWVLSITLVLTLVITVLDYIIPAQGTKKFGGSKYGVWGTNIGLIVGIIAPIPFGFLIGPFAGAFIGELMYNSKDQKRALRAATGSFLGFLAGTFMKIVFTFCLLGLYIWLFWVNRALWF